MHGRGKYRMNLSSERASCEFHVTLEHWRDRELQLNSTRYPELWFPWSFASWQPHLPRHLPTPNPSQYPLSPCLLAACPPRRALTDAQLWRTGNRRLLIHRSALQLTRVKIIRVTFKQWRRRAPPSYKPERLLSPVTRV